MPSLILTTERLILRPIKDADYDPFFTMSSDPRVYEFLPPFPDRAACDAFLDSLRADFTKNGWGFWALEGKESGLFMGISGMHRPGPEFGVRPCVEIGWRLAPEFWGNGFAAEAAREILRFGFMELNLPEIVSFTALGNARSYAVMERIGLAREAETFEMLKLPEGHPFRTHCLYSLSREGWLAANRAQ